MSSVSLIDGHIDGVKTMRPDEIIKILGDCFSKDYRLATIYNKDTKEEVYVTLQNIIDAFDSQKAETAKEIMEKLIDRAWDADTRCGYVQVVDVGDIEDICNEMVGETNV